jgi:formylglycine-generating enzyme required for sulfatase activity/predicted secreted protein
MCDRNKSLFFIVLWVLAVGPLSLLHADSFEEVTTVVGEEFEISLESNPTTGYSWSLVEDLPDWLELVGTTYVATDPGMVGGGGTQTWTFRATGSGSATLTFQYIQPWVGAPAEVRVYQVTAKTSADVEKIDVLVGEEFEINLESNPTTGYSWSLVEHLPDWLELVDTTYVPTDPGMVGGGGVETWTFRATGSGSATLTFEYERPWEDEPIQVRVYLVTARTQESDVDGFETGDFSALAWEQRGAGWKVVSTHPFAGRYCAQSGAIGDGGISTLTCTRDCPAGQIGFAVRVSSEAGYDRLYFQVDDRQIDSWSGEQDWTWVSYPVSPGKHSFAWSYEKDESTAAGADAAWIDEVTFPIASKPSALAGIVFVKIRGGTFEMGDIDGSGSADERPVHTVTLRDFEMSKYETTNAQYAAYLNEALARGAVRVVWGTVYASDDGMLAHPYFDTASASSYSQIEYSQGRFSVRSRNGQSMSDHPVVQVSWYGAKAFCDYYGCRLPTEAEWEYAARGGPDSPYARYPWGGNTLDCSKANCNAITYCNPLGLVTYPYTSPVGYYGPQGAYGLCDMCGNVWEFCADWYGATYYSFSPAGNPSGPFTGKWRVVRGGSWDEGEYRVSARSWHTPTDRTWDGGFRVCR